MVHSIIKLAAFRCPYTVNVPCIKFFKRNYVVNVCEKAEKKIHPYKQIHPWKSLAEFSEDLFNNIIYNKDGLVALNKPYGIKRSGSEEFPYNIPNGVRYTLKDAIPYISERLKYPNLSVIRSPEMYMSGVTLLSADSKIQHAVEVSLIRANYFSNTYWVIAVGVPQQLEGDHRLALKLMRNPNFNGTKAVIITSWTKNDEKLKRIKLLKTKYRVLSNSMLNLCSLIEITSSTKRWHAVRLFASTFLYTPILGDNCCGSRVQKVGDTYLKVDPFLEYANLPPKLDKKLLHLLDVNPAQHNIIPAHLHLRSIVLPYYFGETVTIEAPLMPPFDWTYKRLDFKHFMIK